jgi:hypothetical protein
MDMRADGLLRDVRRLQRRGLLSGLAAVAAGVAALLLPRTRQQQRILRDRESPARMPRRFTSERQIPQHSKRC